MGKNWYNQNRKELAQMYGVNRHMRSIELKYNLIERNKKRKKKYKGINYTERARYRKMKYRRKWSKGARYYAFARRSTSKKAAKKNYQHANNIGRKSYRRGFQKGVNYAYKSDRRMWAYKQGRKML